MLLEDGVLEYELLHHVLKHLWKHSLLLWAKDELKTELVTTRCSYISDKLCPEVAIAAKKQRILWQ